MTVKVTLVSRYSRYRLNEFVISCILSVRDSYEEVAYRNSIANLLT